MKSSTHKYEPMRFEQMGNGAGHVLTGILVGGLIGATAMLFFAPRSGEEMRAEVRDRAVDLRDRTTETVKDKVSEVVSKAGQLRGSAKEKTDDMRQKGQDVLLGHLAQATEALESLKKTIQES